MKLPHRPGETVVLERNDLQLLLDELMKRGYEVVGPVVKSQSVVYDKLSSADELPAGWTDEQKGGSYRLKQREDKALFGYAAGPHSWKKFLLPARLRLWRTDDGLDMFEGQEMPKRLAFLGVRACDLHAIAIQDLILMKGPYEDPHYRSRRERTFILAVNCACGGGTCFCVSMGTGPKATGGFDLALTELLDDDSHRFLIEAGSEMGKEILRSLPHRLPAALDLRTAEAATSQAVTSMGRRLETGGIKELFYQNYEHPRWDDVALRCLTCGNCTMVCPTCFCTTTEDRTDPEGKNAERHRRWDVCYTLDFTYLHGGSVRSSTRGRYRHWITHKLATWIDQYGMSGCVGCGRCITWCPVAIDITEEAAALREGRPDGNA